MAYKPFYKNAKEAKELGQRNKRILGDLQFGVDRSLWEEDAEKCKVSRALEEVKTSNGLEGMAKKMHKQALKEA